MKTALELKESCIGSRSEALLRELLGRVPHLKLASLTKGAQAAISAFRAEAQFANNGYATALEALRRDFNHIDADAPIRAAEFLRGTVANQERAREELVTAARYLLGD